MTGTFTPKEAQFIRDFLIISTFGSELRRSGLIEADDVDQELVTQIAEHVRTLESRSYDGIVQATGDAARDILQEAQANAAAYLLELKEAEGVQSIEKSS